MIDIPSLQTLRAVEAAARHQSFTRAAEELGLTHGAISHRVRALEERLNVKLFLRAGRRMLPTRDGQLLLANIRAGLRQLESAFAAAGATRTWPPAALVISVLSPVASRWLIPRLARFHDRHPDIDLDLRASAALCDLRAEGIDAAMRFGPGSWPGLAAVELAGERLFPVCSPAYRERMGIGTVTDLARCRLLRDPWQSWSPWLQAAGSDLDEPRAGPSYSEAALVLEAAAAGHGVALARGLLAHDDLAAGRLVRPFAVSIEHNYRYYLAWPAQGRIHPAVGPFREWLKEELAYCDLG
jgi:LysR family transcriptional regulator, glycine cleavage system transcriptional activator